MARRFTRRKVLLAGAAATAAAALAGFPYIESRKRAVRHVFLIISDAMRADVIGRVINGVEVTPHLNAFASQAVNFTNAFSAAPATKFSVGSILTGMYPPAHGIEHNYYALPDCLTLQRYMKSKGFITAASVSNPYLAPEKGPDGVSNAPDYGFSSGFDGYVLLGFGKQKNALRHKGIGKLDAYASAEKVNRTVLDLIGRNTSGRFFPSMPPLFAYLHYMDTHQPWVKPLPVPGITGRFHAKSAASPEDICAADNALVEKTFSTLTPADILTEDDVARLVAVYHEACAYADMCFGQFIDELKKRGYFEHSTIIFTSDHGEEFLEHGRVGHDKNLFNTSLRVPLIIKTPEFAPAVVTRRISNAMLFPSIMELFGDEMTTTNLWSFLPYISNPSLADAEVFASWRGRDKVILPDGNEAILFDGENAFFNIASDPAELAPLGDNPSALAALAKARTASQNLASQLSIARRFSTSKWQNPWAAHQDKVAAQLVADKVVSLREATRLKSFGYYLPEDAQAAIAGGHAGADMNQAALSPEEKAQLEALGYLGR